MGASSTIWTFLGSAYPSSPIPLQTVNETSDSLVVPVYAQAHRIFVLLDQGQVAKCLGVVFGVMGEAAKAQKGHSLIAVSNLPLIRGFLICEIPG